MGSRKRNKGRARKEKQKVRDAKGRFETIAWQKVAWPDLRILENDINSKVLCSHGNDMVFEPNHKHSAVELFMNHFFDEVVKDEFQRAGQDPEAPTMCCAARVWHCIKSANHLSPGVWTDKHCHSMAIEIFTRIGVNILLDGGGSHECAAAIVLLEGVEFCSNEEEKEQLILDANALAKLRDLGSGDRDVIRFFTKRIKCGCLKEIYAKSKESQSSKTGLCCQCKTTVEHKSLLVCSNCKVAQFCSKACQVNHW